MVYFIVCVNSGRLTFKIILRPFHGNHVLTFKFKNKLKMVYREMFYLKGCSRVDGQMVNYTTTVSCRPYINFLVTFILQN